MENNEEKPAKHLTSKKRNRDRASGRRTHFLRLDLLWKPADRGSSSAFFRP
jgi:hypothetical protein